MSLTGDTETDRMVPVATRLVGAIREWDETGVSVAFGEAELIAGDPLKAAQTLAVVLAAMVPWDRTPAALLAWLGRREEYQRLVKLGLEPAVANTLINEAARREE